MHLGRVVKKISEGKPGGKEWQDLDYEGWKLLKRIYGRWLKDGDTRRWTEKNRRLQLKRPRLSEGRRAKE
jgi:hypothetical protein